MNIERVQLHQKFMRLFGGDPAFEQKVINHFIRTLKTDSLLRVPDSVIKSACDKPVMFRYEVEEGGQAKLII